MSVLSPVTRRTRSAALATTALVVALGALIGAAEPAAGTARRRVLEPSRRPARVLVISIPHVGWEELRDAPAPNLKRLLGGSAIANLTARSGGGGFAAGYLTLGAGKRSKGTGTSSDGMGFDADARFGSQRAADAYTRRTGRRVADGAIVHLGIVGLAAVNEAEAGGSSIGALGTALRAAGYRTAVIGNGDGSVPDDALPRYRRYAVAAMMDEHGAVDGGRVDRRLLERDPEAPFGLRLDDDAVLAAFRDVWQPDSVVLVEASDLLRAVGARPPSVETQDRKAYAAALERTDELVGALLAQVDPARDAVVVVSPYPSRVSKGLTVVGVRAPGVEPGLLRSSSTRRAGYVILADVAPTILRLLDIARPASMNGRAFTVGPAPGRAQDRIDDLVDAADAALFRDRVLNPVAVLVTSAAGLVALGAVMLWETRRPRPWRGLARFGSSWVLGFVPAVYLARLFPFHHSGVLRYYVFLVGLAAVLAVLSEEIGSRDFTGPTVIGLAVITLVLVGDVVTGARLQLSTAFGYTPTIGVRFSGVGNVAYAYLGSCAIVLAGLVAHRVQGRRGRVVAASILGAVLVVDAAPFLGGDVGGVLSLTPAFLVTGIVLSGTRLRRRHVLGLLAAVVTALVAVAAIDLARPARDRTHLGRLLTNARERGWSEIADVIARKLDRNLDTWTSSIWRSMFAIGAVFVIYLAWRARPRIAALFRRVPELRASMAGFAVLFVLGYALNDSGVAIPGVMLTVLVAVTVGLVARMPEGAPPPAQGEGASPVSTASVRAATRSH